MGKKLALIFPLVPKTELSHATIESFKHLFSHPDVYPVFSDANKLTVEEGKFFTDQYADVDVISIKDGANKSFVLNETIRKLKPDYICLLAPGVTIADGDFLSLLDSFEDMTCSVTPTVIDDGGLVAHMGVLFSRGLPKFADAGKPYNTPRVQQKHYFKGVAGECAIFNVKVVKELGGFNEAYVNAYEGLEISMRAHKAGFRNIHDPSVNLLDIYAKFRWYEGRVINDPDLEHFIDFNGGLEEMDKLNDAAQYYGDQNSQNMPSTELWQHTGGSKKGKIVCFLADHFGCGHYRIKNPFRNLLLRGWDVMFTTYSPMKFIEWGDILIFQRQCADHMYEKIKIARDMGKKIIYDIDDYFHGLELHNPVTPEFQNNPHLLRNIERIIYYSNALTVSTPELAANYGKLNKNTTVIPNCIDLGMIPKPIQENTDGTVRIGWAGSITHDADMQEAVHAIEHIFEKYDNTVLVFIGADYRKYFPGVPPERMEWHSGTSDHEDSVGDYYKLLNEVRLDIGLAPLTDSLFNRNKSFLKFIEYGAYGIVPVASDVSPYRQIVKEAKEKTDTTIGFLCRTEKDWIKNLSKLIESYDLRYEIGTNAQRFIWNHYGASRGGDLMEQICLDLMENDGHSPKQDEPSISLPVTFMNGTTAKKLDELQQLKEEQFKLAIRKRQEEEIQQVQQAHANST